LVNTFTQPLAFTFGVNRCQVEAFLEGLQVFSFDKHSFTGRLRGFPDDLLFILLGKSRQQRIEFLPTANVRYGYQMVPAEVPSFSFHAAFLVALCRSENSDSEIPM